MKKILKKIVIFLMSIILLGSIVFVLVAGFPGEQIIIIRNARRYVIETHGLTPTHIEIVNFFIDSPVHILIETEEDDFWFHVIMRRFDYRNRYTTDNYLERMTAHILSKELSAYVDTITEGVGRAFVALRSHRLTAFTLNELRNDNTLPFEKLIERFWVGISFDKNISDVDYDLAFNIFSCMIELRLEPYRIVFFYHDKNNPPSNRTQIGIDSRHFSYINSPEDLRQRFQGHIDRS